MRPDDAVRRLKDYWREVVLLSHVQALLGWDQETYMPEGAVEERAAQQALLQGLIHRRKTAPEVGELLAAAGASEERPEGAEELGEVERALVRETYREWRRATKLPEDLVRRFAETTSRAQVVWQRARAEDDFGMFAPHLEEILSLVREIAERLGYEEHPYDALLDEYEPYMKASQVRAVFDQLEGPLVRLLEEIMEAGEVDDSPLHRHFPREGQEQVSRRILTDMGFDWKRGRLDVSAHPFTTTLAEGDIRITTRYMEDFLPSSLFGSIHEGGHALYEQGIAEDLAGTILADGTSLGIHESQSRFWENVVGRSRAFWQKYFPLLKETFSSLSDVEFERFYRAINKVKPSHIRVEADEVTYNLHILLRFRLELALVEGRLAVKDLPEAWREESRRLLGIVPERDAEGVLQDIHWSFGGIGYFPTYTLGNLYSAQFARAMERDLGDLSSLIAEARFDAILGWLREKIHRHGRTYPAHELCLRATGETLNPDYFLSYLRGKYSDVYGLS
ncbi:carboxypeptidase M32 [Spirochaeta thermophila]|uniref:Metal-dependent carboxypeptidase n=1 Tax=Winmispira thermophila (strain ATCC 49972 / DSM 6192 / RI 19.B1) TaxID=665571 RepID=E0RN73_WINT6|nr:carboxypeptidase M32 [Spirochaeta thermophila]ADN02542.1 thermostable carboxypeptidase 1 [Spirochaeta thermophila DSM 6192]